MFLIWNRATAEELLLWAAQTVIVYAVLEHRVVVQDQVSGQEKCGF